MPGWRILDGLSMHSHRAIGKRILTAMDDDVLRDLTLPLTAEERTALLTDVAKLGDQLVASGADRHDVQATLLLAAIDYADPLSRVPSAKLISIRDAVLVTIAKTKAEAKPKAA
jgi:hypothetical protein